MTNEVQLDGIGLTQMIRPVPPFDMSVVPTGGQALVWDATTGKYRPAAVVAPSPVTLTASGGAITPDASVSNVFRHTATADVVLNPPIGGIDGQQIVVEVLASGAARTLTIGAGTVAIPSGTWWVGRMIYHSTGDVWVSQ